MTQINNVVKNKKKERIKISSIDEFKKVLITEGYKINEFKEEEFKEIIKKIFSIDDTVINKIYNTIEYDKINYRADNINDFIDYIEKIILFEKEHNRLCEKISEVKILNIARVEYERVQSSQDNVEDIIKAIEEIKNKISRIVEDEEKIRLEELEKEIDKDYIYAKDIELLKKMISSKKDHMKEKYNVKSKVKTISMEIPKNIEIHYIVPKKGTVEYHQHLNSNIPRMQRLIKNINKYMEADEKEKGIFSINQSNALQDSINIAIAIYNNKEFRAISGSNNIESYCKAPAAEKAIFRSSKVNKLGKLGIGYNRVNDSEKKILEEIHKQIESQLLSNEGTLTMYSKWEPCPSCCYVISQFCKMYPKINLKVKYNKRYGE